MYVCMERLYACAYNIHSYHSRKYIEHKLVWTCYNTYYPPKSKKRKWCGFQASHFKGTFLENTHLPPWKILGFIVLWLNKGFQHRWAVDNLSITLKSSVDWRSFCCEVTESWLDSQAPIGGQDVIVEIDETLIVRRKNNVGRQVPQLWLFGGIERVSKKRFVVPLLDDKNRPKARNKENLIGYNIIIKYILPGSVIFSDQWRAYSTVAEEGYRHKTINHSLNFVDPEDKEVHTQNIERLWFDIKQYIKRQGMSPVFIKQYISPRYT